MQCFWFDYDKESPKLREFDPVEAFLLRRKIIRAIQHGNTELKYIAEYCESKSKFRTLDESLFNHCMAELQKKGVIREIKVPVTENINEYYYEINKKD